MKKEIVCLRDVTKSYQQGQLTVKAVDNLSVAFTEGEFSVICGPSGSGKTTTLNMVGALDIPSAGTVEVEGKDIGKMSRSTLAALRRDRIGFVFQAYNLIPVLTAYENAEYVLGLQRLPASERRERVMNILEAVGLKGLEDRRPDEMSGGQQQRVAIARAIVSKPAIVLADEPTANVDSETAEALLDIMTKLNEEHGVTFLFSTHDDRVMKRARRIIQMRDGKIVEDELRN